MLTRAPGSSKDDWENGTLRNAITQMEAFLKMSCYQVFGWLGGVSLFLSLFSFAVNLQWNGHCQPFGGLFAIPERSKASYGHHRPKARPLLQSQPLPPLWNLCVWCCWPHCVTWVKRRTWDELVARNDETWPCFKGFHWWRLFFQKMQIDMHWYFIGMLRTTFGYFFSCTDDIVLLFASPFWNVHQFRSTWGGKN